MELEQHGYLYRTTEWLNGGSMTSSSGIWLVRPGLPSPKRSWAHYGGSGPSPWWLVHVCQRDIPAAIVKPGFEPFPMGLVHTVDGTSYMIWRDFIWTWANCGGARCPGAHSGRALHRIVSITSARNRMWVIPSRRPVWGNGFCLGLLQELRGTHR